MTPNYLPLVIPPRPWTTPTNGGYYAKHLSTELLKSNAQVVAAHSDGSEAFMSAANRQQCPVVSRWLDAGADPAGL